MDKDRIVFFDGVCNLCNRSVQFIIRRDKKNKFRFASLQGKAGQAFLRRSNLPASAYNSFILTEDDKVFTRSTATLRVARNLPGAWKLLYAFIIVPPFIRDAVYNWIARNRYKWFGKKDECMIPSPGMKERFLD
jgi:predicted DCC family thiol-disulfide oxidoreductase YuxK